MRTSIHGFRWPRLVIALVAAAALILATPGMASAADQFKSSHKAEVVLTGHVVVAADETVGDVVIFDGPVTVFGHVDGSVVAFNGPVTIAGGRVDHDVTVLNDRAYIQSGSYVAGNVVSRHAAVVAADANVVGTVEKLSVSVSPMFGFVARFALWLAVTLSLLVIGELMVLLAPKALARATAALDVKPGAVIGTGLITAVALPILILLAFVTLLGIPLGLVLLFALALLVPVAYTVAGLFLGRRIASAASPAVAFLAGFGILRVLAIVPIVGGLVFAAASIVGTGALLVASWRSGHPTTGTATPRPLGVPTPAAG